MAAPAPRRLPGHKKKEEKKRQNTPLMDGRPSCNTITQDTILFSERDFTSQFWVKKFNISSLLWDLTTSFLIQFLQNPRQAIQDAEQGMVNYYKRKETVGEGGEFFLSDPGGQRCERNSCGPSSLPEDNPGKNTPTPRLLTLHKLWGSSLTLSSTSYSFFLFLFIHSESSYSLFLVLNGVLQVLTTGNRIRSLYVVYFFHISIPL